MLLNLLLACLSFSIASSLPSASHPDNVANINERSDVVTRNDVVDGICRPVTLIFARGTWEPGNVGLIVGPPFFAALSSRLPRNSLAFQGVNYDADLWGYFQGGDPEGARKMAGLVYKAASTCPDTKIVVAGYSQGAQVVHRQNDLLGPFGKGRIAGVALFGDPDDGDALPGIPTRKIDTTCIKGDLICDGLPIVDPDHLAYGFTVDHAADFIVRQLKAAEK